ncbi:MAG: hypothetical protein WCC04_05920 [Terriglobales bacterium]
MKGKRAEIRRCQHIKTNGTQCGSPALRNEPFCFYHREAQPERVEVSGEDGKACGQVLVPVFEDAGSIQTMVRQVVKLVLEGKIDTKRAGTVLYGLQIASTNLKRMEAERPRPAQVVVDPEKVAETPLGMTPWSQKEKGYEVEDIATGFQGELAMRLKRETVLASERYQIKRNNELSLAKDIKNYLQGEPPLTLDNARWLLGLVATRLQET